MNRLLGRSVYGEFKTTCRIVLASLEAEKKQFYYFWQHFLIKFCVSRYTDSGSRQRTGVHIPRHTVMPRYTDILSFCPYSESAVLSVYRDPSPCPYTVTGRNRQSVYRDPSVLGNTALPFSDFSVERCLK